MIRKYELDKALQSLFSGCAGVQLPFVERSHRLRQTTGPTIVSRRRGSECRATDAPKFEKQLIR